LKVLFINHVSQVSGAEKSLLTLLSPLEEMGVQTMVAAPEGGALTEALKARRVTFLPIRGGRLTRRHVPLAQMAWCFRAVADASFLGREGRARGVRIYHANSTGAAMSVCPHPWVKPLVWHLRDLSPLGGWGRLLYRRSSAVVAISEAVGDALARLVGTTRKIHVIPNGIDPCWLGGDPEGGTAVRKEWQIEEEAILVGSVGQLVPWKRHEDLVEAVAILHERTPSNVKGVVVGGDLFQDHPLYQKGLRTVAWARTEGRVRCAGYREDMPSVMSALDVLVCPSQAEPFGRVLLEAMACERPVVATRAGGAPEVVEDGVTGILVEPGRPDQIADALDRLARDPELRSRMGRAGRSRVEQRFLAKETARKLKALYDTLLS